MLGCTLVARSETATRPVVAVAYSAGRDSTALLHATARAGQAQGFDVAALHVHHGLMPQADEWLELAVAQCRRWHQAGLPVRLQSTRLTGKPAKGDSVEAWARRERRSALARMAREVGASAVLMAHHRRDQAETVLLQALRGAGAAGLAAMPRAVERDGLWWLRPWLDQPREAIEAYVRQHKLRYVDDASNADPRFARSRLRAKVWPTLLESFADAEGALVMVARRAQEAQAILAAAATTDLQAVVDGERLNLAAWRQLDDARRANALRAWLHRRLGRSAPESLIERLISELPRATSARWPVDGAHQLALYRARLSLVGTPAQRGADDGRAIDLSSPGVHALPHWGGAIEVQRAERGGVSPALLKGCTLHARRGGEQFQAQPRSTPRSLKKQYQAAGVAAWQREGPLVFAGDRLLYVPGLGLDARCLRDPAPRSGSGLTLHWCAATREQP